jgi:hypothetical protein
MIKGLLDILWALNERIASSSIVRLHRVLSGTWSWSPPCAALHAHYCTRLSQTCIADAWSAVQIWRSSGSTEQCSASFIQTLLGSRCASTLPARAQCARTQHYGIPCCRMMPQAQPSSSAHQTLAVQSRELSSRLNVAYDVLINGESRLKYDGMFKRAGFPSSSFERVEGLTGPLSERAVPLGVRLAS